MDADKDALTTKYVVSHPSDGVYLGSFYGYGIWSKQNAEGHDAAVAFDSPEDAKERISSLEDFEGWEKSGYQFHQVHVSNKADEATADELNSAGLGGSLGKLALFLTRERKLEPWEMTFDQFTGPALLGPIFATQGRDAEEYEWLWEAASDGVCLGEPAWSDEGGYSVRELLDCDPPGTFVLLSPQGAPCGFYMDSGFWIDPEHRGRGLGTRLILAAAEFHGGSPTNNVSGLGFSEDGYKAHRRAHFHAVEEALNQGKEVPPEVLDEYGLTASLSPRRQ